MLVNTFFLANIPPTVSGLRVRADDSKQVLVIVVTGQLQVVKTRSYTPTYMITHEQTGLHMNRRSYTQTDGTTHEQTVLHRNGWGYTQKGRFRTHAVTA